MPRCSPALVDPGLNRRVRLQRSAIPPWHGARVADTPADVCLNQDRNLWNFQVTKNGGATQSFRGAGPWATATADEIIEHVRGQIARYKVPDYIDFVAELPKTFTGKIQK